MIDAVVTRFYLCFVCALFAGCSSFPMGTTATQTVVGSIESLDLSRSKPDDRVRPLGNGMVHVTNACGVAKAVFNIYVPKQGVGETVTVRSAIGEWCRSPFNFNDEYFLIIKGREILLSEPVLYTEGGEPVLSIDQEYLDEIVELTELPTNALRLEDFPDVVLHPDNPDVQSPYIAAKVHAAENLDVHTIDGKDYVIITKGLILRRLFPEIEEAE